MEVINDCLNDFKDNAVFTEESEPEVIEKQEFPPILHFLLDVQ
jgi:hypothetical protein